MATVRVPDVLLRISPKLLEKYQSAVVMGAGRGRAVPVPYTFTRADAVTAATYIDRDGLIRKAAANKLRVEFPRDANGPILDALGEPIRGFLLEGSRTNLIENGDYETDAVGSTVTVGATLVRDNAQARFGSWSLKITTSNAIGSGVAWIKRDGTRMAAAASTAYDQSVWVYAPAASVGKTMIFALEWWNSAPAVISTSFSGVLTLVAGWQRLDFAATSPVGTVTARTFFETSAAQGVFDIWVDLVQFEAGAFRSNAIPTGTAAVTRAADGFSVPINFGLFDTTVFARIARPVHADASGDLGLNPRIWMLGAASPGASSAKVAVGFAFESSSRLLKTIMDTDTTDQIPTVAMPAGNPVTTVVELRNFGTGVQANMDVGSGFGGFSAAASPASAWNGQTLYVGQDDSGTQQLFGGLIDLIVIRGLVSLTEALAIP